MKWDDQGEFLKLTNVRKVLEGVGLGCEYSLNVGRVSQGSLLGGF
jgi:hypothetical protein